MPRRYLGSFETYNPVLPTNQSASGMWPLNQQLQALAAGNWPLPFGDPYFNYTSLLLSTTSLSNANNNLFVDSSGAFSPISRNGNTTQGSATPYGTYWSNYFDGSGDWISAPDNAAFDFGSGDFTVEFWINFNSVTGNIGPIGKRANETVYSPFLMEMTSSALRLYMSTSGSSWAVNGLATPTLVTGSWYHIAVSRSGTTVYMFVNGVSVGSTASLSGAVMTNTSPFYFASNSGSPVGAAPLNGYMSNIRIVKGTALYTSNFTPSTTPLTAISGTSLLTCQSNRFRDASSNNFTITRNGDTRVTDFSPFLHTAPIAYNQSDITNWSGYFDGSGDFLAIADNAAFDFGTGDFTIECWVYLNAYNPTFGSEIFSAHTYGSSADYIFNINTTGKLFFQIGSSTSLFTSTNSVPLNQWTHIAVVRSGNTFTPYINGVNAGGAATSSSAVNASRTLTIGSDLTGNAGASLNGYISNHRVVKGTAVYTSNFTPSTTPLTAISGTSLLTCQNAAFTDNSANSFVITPNGNVTVTGNSPFNTAGYWSNYFDGTTDWLSVADNDALDFGTGDFTVEFWAYFPTAPSGTVTFIGGWTTGEPANGWSVSMDTNEFNFYSAVLGSYVGANNTAARTPNTWHHIAAVRSSGNLRVYVNGVGGTPVSNTQNITTAATGLNIGRSPYAAYPNYVTGYLSNVRVVKGTAVYTSNFTPPTAPLTAVSGTSLLTCQNGRFIDNSTNAATITPTGNVSVQSFNPFYTATIASNGGSMYFDGSGDYLTMPSNAAFQVGTGQFTLECWIYFNTVTNINEFLWADSSGATGGRLVMYYSGGGLQIVAAGGAGATTASWTPVAGQWYHLAASRDASNNQRLFVNGVLLATATSTNDYTQNGFAVARAASLNGYMAGIRLVKGTALYTATFTPPTAPVTPTAATTLLLNGMNAGAYDATAINDMETVGNAQVSTVQSKFGGSSMYFDGSGDWLTTASNNTLSMGTGNFTAEMWVYPTSVTSYRILIDNSWDTATYAWQIFINAGTVSVYAANGAGANLNVDSTSTVSANVWTHIAVVKSGTTVTIYLNGTASGSGTMNTTFGRDAVNYVGAQAGTPYAYEGYIDDLRITKGVARYTSNFTPPTAALPTF